MTGGGSSSSSSSSPPTNPRHHFHPPPLDIPASTHNGHPAAAAASPKPPPQPQQEQHQQQYNNTPPLLLTVRFSTSIPDLLLDIPHPGTTTVAALKHLIRSRLEQPNSQRRLRFIHGGKILPDHAVLSAVLKALPPPPTPAHASYTRDDTHRHQDSRGKGKGKGKAVEGGGGGGGGRSGGGGSAGQQRVYVNCSIGDLLTDAELDEERKKAEEPAPEQQQQPPAGSGTAAAAAAAAAATATATGSLLSGPFQPGSSRLHHSPGGVSRERTPRGFDRLLSAGFTAAEVNQLRLQFRSIQEARHTADTMPSPDTLRVLEDAWIDNNHGNDAGAAGAGGPAAGDGIGEAGEDGAAVVTAGEEFGIAGVLDLLLVGMFVGFVWPLGAVGWLVRDEEKISKRMRVFMYLGFVLSLVVGTIRALG